MTVVQRREYRPQHQHWNRKLLLLLHNLRLRKLPNSRPKSDEIKRRRLRIPGRVKQLRRRRIREEKQGKRDVGRRARCDSTRRRRRTSRNSKPRRRKLILNDEAFVTLALVTLLPAVFELGA
jgi:hypothetical protein